VNWWRVIGPSEGGDVLTRGGEPIGGPEQEAIGQKPEEGQDLWLARSIVLDRLERAE